MGRVGKGEIHPSIVAAYIDTWATNNITTYFPNIMMVTSPLLEHKRLIDRKLVPKRLG